MKLSYKEKETKQNKSLWLILCWITSIAVLHRSELLGPSLCSLVREPCSHLRGATKVRISFGGVDLQVPEQVPGGPSSFSSERALVPFPYGERDLQAWNVLYSRNCAKTRNPALLTFLSLS